MKIVRSVQLEDGRTITATVRMSDLIAFERHFDVDVSAGVSRFEHWAYLTWHALRRQGDITEEFDAFVDLVDEWLPEEDAPKAPSKRASRGR